MWGMLWPFAYPSPPFRNVEEFSFNTRPGTRCAPLAVEDPELTSQVGGLHLTITPTGTVGAVEADLPRVARQSRSQQQITQPNAGPARRRNRSQAPLLTTHCWVEEGAAVADALERRYETGLREPGQIDQVQLQRRPHWSGHAEPSPAVRIGEVIALVEELCAGQEAALALQRCLCPERRRVQDTPLRSRAGHTRKLGPRPRRHINRSVDLLPSAGFTGRRSGAGRDKLSASATEAR